MRIRLSAEQSVYRVEYCMIRNINNLWGEMLSCFRSSVVVEGEGWLGSGRKVDS